MAPPTLRSRDPQLDICWVGRKGSIEERVSRTAAIPFRPVRVQGWPRAGLVSRVRALFVLAVAVLRSASYLLRFRPHLVLGVGGYVSVPAVWVAQRMKFRTVIHEQNKHLGLANRLLAPRADAIFLSYSETGGAYPESRARITGNPVRRGFLQPPNRDEARKRLDLADPRVVLVTGGSQGAASLNEAVGNMLAASTTRNLQLLWMAGASGVAEARRVSDRVEFPVIVYTFIDDMVTAMAAADLVVTRSGASSTAELACMGRASILIPYPHATDDHQTENARAFSDAGAAVLLPDRELDGTSLLDCIESILNDDVRRESMEAAARELARPGAAEAIVDHMLELVFDGCEHE